MPNDVVPPLSGIARRKRSDAGKPRNSTMDQWYDQFTALTYAQQETALEVLRALHRAARRNDDADRPGDAPENGN